MTLESWNMGHILSEPKDVAISTAVSIDLTKTGDFLSNRGSMSKEMVSRLSIGSTTHRHPGLFNILTTCFIVSASTFGGVMSI